MAKQQINLSNALAFEVMIIPDIDINNPSKFRSDLRYFSRLTRKFSLIYLLWKPKFPKSIFNSMAFFTKNFPRTEKFSRSTILIKTLNAENCYPNFFFISQLLNFHFQSGIKFTCVLNKKKMIYKLWELESYKTAHKVFLIFNSYSLYWFIKEKLNSIFLKMILMK